MNQLIHALLPLEQAEALIRSGRPCCVAGDEALLTRLPRGTWIGGTIPYFMAAEGGTASRDQVFVAELPQQAGEPRVQVYPRELLHTVCLDAPEHGFSVMVLPAFSEVHEVFAQGAPGFEEMYLHPLVGWVAGVHLDDLGRARPRVIHGPTGQLMDNAAVVMHVPVSESQNVFVDIVNLFVQGEGPVLEFDQDGFSAGMCRIGGHQANLHDWLVREKIDTQLPLVADYCGAMINVSIKHLDPVARQVDFYAPVFADVPYRIARPVGDYVTAFSGALARTQVAGDVVFCCNCILNYAYGGLQGRKTGALGGPMTFGEIGYQLLNQTLVYLSLEAA